jgi:hypothetical protein
MIRRGALSASAGGQKIFFRTGGHGDLDLHRLNRQIPLRTRLQAAAAKVKFRPTFGSDQNILGQAILLKGEP